MELRRIQWFTISSGESWDEQSPEFIFYSEDSVKRTWKSDEVENYLGSPRFKESHIIESLEARCLFWGRRVPDSKLDSTEDPLCMGPAAHTFLNRDQTSSNWCGADI
ncbi:hypothetical protein AVEN_3505-1 [Araneus ventricosus]|uniref:Uncharacterized protein n=1 Tax=Araneus ventricosus TaxID=182803 RepID=A0A4Y2T3K0_ARAVE|nr:hypothetical protein AVEN_3505-1 [Araneus ventricosus]